VVGNGFGKLMGSTQLAELGEIETPILLTNTLAIPRAAEALIDWTLSQPGNEDVRSVNPIVGETNDGKLNNIRTRALTVEHMLQAIHAASEGPVLEGCVGAGTGTICFGWKGGIGSSSRVLPGGYTLGALVQSNFGGVLLGGSALHLSSQKDVSIQEESADLSEKDHPKGATHFSDGSIMIVLATDTPLSDRKPDPPGPPRTGGTGAGRRRHEQRFRRLRYRLLDSRGRAEDTRKAERCLAIS
jgi:D-aminopeptidase